jgi:hypothetical protein
MGDCDIAKVLPAYIGAATGVVGTILAFHGFQKWRSEMLGKSDFETARLLLTKVVALDNVCRDARFICDSRNISPSVDKVADGIRDFEQALTVARVAWGTPLTETATNNLLRRVYFLRNSMLTVSRMYKEEHGTMPPTLEQMNAFHAAQNYVFKVATNDDEFAGEMSKSISEFEEVLKPYLARKVKSRFAEEWNRTIAMCRGESPDDEADL